MQRLVSDDELQQILERDWSQASRQAQLQDYWHETKFHPRRRSSRDPAFQDHSNLDRNFRDLEAFKRHEHSEAFPEHLP